MKVKAVVVVENEIDESIRKAIDDTNKETRKMIEKATKHWLFKRLLGSKREMLEMLKDVELIDCVEIIKGKQGDAILIFNFNDAWVSYLSSLTPMFGENFAKERIIDMLKKDLKKYVKEIKSVEIVNEVIE